MVPKFKDIRVAVIVALAEEYETFCRYFDGDIVEKFHIDERITVDILESRTGLGRVGLTCINRMGNVSSGIVATKLLEIFDLDVVVNIGLAAGVNLEKQQLGDVVIADKIRYYETGKLRSKGLDLAPEYSDLRSSALSEIQKATPTQWPLGASIGGAPRQVHIGTIASGEKVISNANFVSALVNQDRTIVGIEMEGYGIASALFGRKEKFLLIRGICDFADHEKNDSARLSAMEGAVRLFNEALRRRLISPQKTLIYEITSDKYPTHSVIYIKKQETIEGIANNYVQIERKKTLEGFRYRKSIIEKMAAKFSLGELRNFCIALEVDFDELRGETKTDKAASLLDYVCRKGLLGIDEFAALIDEQ